jgi:hypothetical protein
MEKITAFKTSDGVVHEDAQKAIRHEKDLRIKQAIKSIVSGFFFYDMCENDITEAIFEHKREFISLITKIEAEEYPEFNITRSVL